MPLFLRRLGQLCLALSGLLAASYLVSFVPVIPIRFEFIFIFAFPLIPAWFLLVIRSISAGEISFRAAPIWQRRIIPFVVLFAVINFLFVTGGLDGYPETRNGHHYLTYQGKVIRELTASAYRVAHQANFRAVTGHVLLFLYVAGVGLAHLPREADSPED